MISLSFIRTLEFLVLNGIEDAQTDDISRLLTSCLYAKDGDVKAETISELMDTIKVKLSAKLDMIENIEDKD